MKYILSTIATEINQFLSGFSVVNFTRFKTESVTLKMFLKQKIIGYFFGSGIPLQTQFW